ncbi:hypothetical protein ElyMa_006175800 [Elysia marginata]|uniref:Uncharacterized protein n=1 Tax=Elysia marginata TaxID=1093978 RepID=A0AAV4H1A4_9GAST|nr:hypothetical protein ElyMa_006175800 [Elysia marginata]
MERTKKEHDPKKVLMNFQNRFVPVKPTETPDTAGIGDLMKLTHPTRESSDENDASSVSYDTDYQHQSANSCSEDDEECLLANPKKRKKIERVSVDIFSDNRGDTRAGGDDNDDDEDDSDDDDDNDKEEKEEKASDDD